MTRQHLLALTALCAGTLLSGCALTKDTIDIAYSPDANARPIPGASARAVQVSVEDLRSTKDCVSRKKNGYGMEMAPIVTRENVPDIVRRALESELQQRGFRIGGGGAGATVDLTRFYSNWEVGFWTATAAGEVTLQVRVRGTNYSRTVTGTERNSGEMMLGGGGAKEALELALRDAMRKLFDDPAFVQALLRRG